MRSPAYKIKERLNQWREIEEKATPGPWWLDTQFGSSTDDGGWPTGARFDKLKPINWAVKNGSTGQINDFKFIAYSRNNSATHRAVLEKCVEALNKYMHHIPVNRVISEESAAYEKEFGVGRLARETLEVVAEMLSGGDV